MGLRFFELLLKRRKAVVKERRRAARRDPFEGLVESTRLRQSMDRRELEERVRELEVLEADVQRHCGGSGRKAARRVAARNGLLECAVCEWPEGTDVFSLVQARGTEVLRVWSGKLVLTEHYYLRGRMVPYCVAELGAGTVVSMPPGMVYRVENRRRERARTLHFLSPPPSALPDSEGVRRLCEQSGVSVI